MLQVSSVALVVDVTFIFIFHSSENDEYESSLLTTFVVIVPEVWFCNSVSAVQPEVMSVSIV